MPMWPVHTWLPDAHVQAPTAGSVVLAAILLKMGGYGFLRFSLPMFPVGSEVMGPLVLWLSAIAIIYTSLVALVQKDMKKLIAYSSVAHMGYVTMGIFAVNTWIAVFATTGVILSAAYALWLYRRVVMGDLIKESLRTISDMTSREKFIMAPLIFMTLLLGVYPALVLDITGPSVAALVAHYDSATAAFEAASHLAAN
eukprot:maker-scaffold1567_size35476-snap-gene-0.18 protein:Tk05929 transcript:maker-scaffold1567_size35476-snap-gene-0.18-mRNA-1 annotation:"nadh-quinone oxidoreductase chain 13"